MHMSRMRIAKIAALLALIVVADSLLGRSGQAPPATEPKYRDTRFWRIFHRITQRIDQRRGWDSAADRAGARRAHRHSQRPAPDEPL